MKTCNSCNHCSRQTPNNQGWCNRNVGTDNKPVLVKLDGPECRDYWTGKLWRDGFGFQYRYDWQTNSFICDQTGRSLEFKYLETLREISQ